MTEPDDLNVFFINMDIGIHEHVVHNEDDSYTIFINARHSKAQQEKAFTHALEHIKNDDWAKYEVQKIEDIAHGLLPDPAQEHERKWEERAKAYRKKYEREHRKLMRLLRKYEREAERMGLPKWNEKQLDIYERNKANPDWKLYP